MRQDDESNLSTDDYSWRVLKRGGSSVGFDYHKICQAITKAGKVTLEFNEEVAKQLTLRVLTVLGQLSNKNDAGIISFAVEQIQDTVEEVLLYSPYKATAKSYILYREQRRSARQLVRASQVSLVDDYLGHIDWRVLENSNMCYSLQGLNNHLATEISRTYWLDKIYSSEIREAHLNGDLHLHDLGLLSVYCVGWDLQDLLISGFTGVSGKISSYPARHFRTVLGQIVNFFYTLQGEAAGAQAFANFDTLLAPFIRFDNLSEKEVRQALQEFIFNVNIPTRVGFQTPFTNLSFDLEVPGYLKDQPVIIGGKDQKETYSEFQAEMNLLNRIFLEVLVKGDASGRIFTFPIPTYSITKNFNWENGNLQSLWEATAKYGVPYFANFVNSDMSPDDVRSMCCRLQIDVSELRRRGGGLFGANPLTGSVGVVTINMPRIGYLAKNKEEFIDRLYHLMDLSFDSLELKRKTLENLTEEGLYPYSSFYLRNIKKRTGAYWTNHFSTIGILGMHEAAILHTGNGVDTTKGRDFAVEILELMRDRLSEYQERSGHINNLEATPAEGTSYSMTQHDWEHYPEIRERLGYDDKRIYTNSSQLPVDFGDDVFRAFDLQDPLQSLYTGGTVLHVFLGEAVADPDAVKDFVRTVCSNYRLPYFSLTPTFSICPVHGYLVGELSECPTCGEKTEIYSRVVGYCRPIQQWNVGKRLEFARRATGKFQ